VVVGAEEEVVVEVEVEEVAGVDLDHRQ
jgi:hypothetical protein